MDPKEQEVLRTLFEPEETIEISYRLLDRDPTLLDEIRERADGRLSEEVFTNLEKNLGFKITDDETCSLALTRIREVGGNKLNRPQRRALDFLLNVLETEEEDEEVEIPSTHIVSLMEIIQILPQYTCTIAQCIKYILAFPEETLETQENQALMSGEKD